MGITSLQVCMDSNDWLQGAISEDGTGMDSSSPITTPTTGDEMLTCSRPLIERRLRPQHEQSLKCPRCESTHTKFCYYNNYSLSQPRYFCKTCRRYWTKGGTLRNIPVGGGCRKNKKVSSKKSSPSDQSPSSSSVLPNMSSHSPLSSYNNHANATDLHLAFPEQIQFSHLHASALYGTGPYNLLDTPAPIDFMENKYEALLGTHDSFIGGGENYGGAGIMQPPPLSAAGFHGGAYFDQRLMLPYQHQHDQNGHFNQNRDDVEVKPNGKVLSLEWHDHQQACNSDGYNFGGLGSWAGLMNGYGPSATNPLV